MASVEFCEDGFFVRAVKEGPVTTLALVEDGREVVSLPCDLDQLLAAAHGLTYQIAAREGHVQISGDGPKVEVQFACEGECTHSCSIPRGEYEDALLSLKTA